MKRLRLIALAFASAWVISLIVAAGQLHTWQERVARVLVQLEANARVETQAAAARQGLQASWHRDRALALLEAVAPLHEPGSWWWAMAMPGSWRIFDDLETRANHRIGHALREMVVEAVRRAVERRVGRLTGTALDPDTEMLDTGSGCTAPASPTQPAQAIRTLDMAQSAEFESMAAFLMQAARIDEAVASLLALERDPARHAQTLGWLVRDSFGAKWPEAASHSVSLLRPPPEAAGADLRALAHRVTTALRCTAAAGMQDLLDRLTRHNPLLENERALREALHASRTEDGPDSAAWQAWALESLSRLQAQQDLLASAPHAWMHPDAPAMGAAHETLLAQIARTPLLGSALADRLRRQARHQQAQLQEAIRGLTTGPQASLTWDAEQGQLMASPQRIALHAYLSALLQAHGCTPREGACRFSSPASPPAPWDGAGARAAPVSVAD